MSNGGEFGVFDFKGQSKEPCIVGRFGPRKLGIDQRLFTKMAFNLNLKIGRILKCHFRVRFCQGSF